MSELTEREDRNEGRNEDLESRRRRESDMGYGSTGDGGGSAAAFCGTVVRGEDGSLFITWDDGGADTRIRLYNGENSNDTADVRWMTSYEAEWRPLIPMMHRWEEEWDRRIEAEAKAEPLLLEHLTPEQRHDWKANAQFTINLPNGHEYTIYGEEDYVVTDGDGYAYCLQAKEGWIPGPDEVLAKKLLLEANEEEFLRLANRWFEGEWA